MFIFSLVCQGDWVIFVDQLDMNTPRWTKEKKRMQKQAGFDDQKAKNNSRVYPARIGGIICSTPLTW